MIGDLSVRVSPVDGPVAERVSAIPDGWVLGRRSILALVHGYNNTERDARESYQVFIQHLSGEPLRHPPDVGRFFWPGDGGLGFFSAASYPWEITPARDSGRRLVEFFGHLFGPEGGPVEVNLVGHSLGCRLVLEALWLVATGRAAGGPEVRRVCLMAAAVPVDLVDVGGRLRPAVEWPRALLLLYSPSDRVLRFAFPVGEIIARLVGEEDGFYTRAVGSEGQPAGLTPYRRELTGAGHSDYWGDSRSADWIAEFLGEPVPRDLAARALGGRELLTRDLPDARIPGS